MSALHEPYSYRCACGRPVIVMMLRRFSQRVRHDAKLADSSVQHRHGRAHFQKVGDSARVSANAWFESSDAASPIVGETAASPPTIRRRSDCQSWSGSPMQVCPNGGESVAKQRHLRWARRRCRTRRCRRRPWSWRSRAALPPEEQPAAWRGNRQAQQRETSIPSDVEQHALTHRRSS